MFYKENRRCFGGMRASKNKLPTVTDTKIALVKEAVWGEIHVEYDVFKERMDVAPLLKGLPNDRDPCPHWGIILKGQMLVKCDGTEEIVKAGEAYYLPPGRTA